MLIDIDVHHLARIAHSLSEMEKLLKSGTTESRHLCDVFECHKSSCMCLVKLVNEERVKENEKNVKAKGVMDV